MRRVLKPGATNGRYFFGCARTPPGPCSFFAWAPPLPPSAATATATATATAAAAGAVVGRKRGRGEAEEVEGGDSRNAGVAIYGSATWRSGAGAKQQVEKKAAQKQRAPKPPPRVVLPM